MINNETNSNDDFMNSDEWTIEEQKEYFAIRVLQDAESLLELLVGRHQDVKKGLTEDASAVLGAFIADLWRVVATSPVALKLAFPEPQNVVKFLKDSSALNPHNSDEGVPF